MTRNLRHTLSAVLLFIVTAAPCVRAVDDIITLEAFIQLHIMTHNKEVEVRDRLVNLGSLQLVTTNQTKATKDKMEIYHDRLKAAQSWLMLASSLSNLAIDILDTKNAVADYLKVFPEVAAKSPAGIYMYGDAVYRIEQLVKKALKQMAKLEIANLNVLRATMQQRLDMVYFVKGTLSQIRSIMYSTMNYCRYVTGREYVTTNIRDIINSESAKAALQTAKSLWDKK